MKKYVGSEGLGFVPNPGELIDTSKLVGDIGPFKIIYVHFEDKEGIEEFSKLIGKVITSETKAIWYP